MRQKRLLIVILLALVLVMLTPSIKADMFPKPTLGIEVNYEKGRNVYFDLLVKGDPSDEMFEHGFDLDLELLNYLKVTSFDGYVSASLFRGTPFYGKVNNNQNGYTLNLQYLYPQTFKILLFDKTNNSILISDEFSQTAFDAKASITFTKDFVSNNYDEITVVSDEGFKVEESNNYSKGILGITARVLLTILIELGLLYLFMYRKKKSFVLVGLTNLITHTILTIILFTLFYTGGIVSYVIGVILGELIVIAVEMLFYAFVLKEHSRRRALFYGILANIITIAVAFIPFFF